MAAVDEIAVKLGLKTSEFRAALKEANAEVKVFKDKGKFSEDEGFSGTLKGIKKQLGDFKTMLAAGGLMTAMTSFFALAIKGAKESKDATDTSAEAVREFAKGLEEVQGIATKVAVLTVGTFNKLGSAIGDAANIAKSFYQNGLSGFDKWAEAEEHRAQGAKAATEAEMRLAEVKKKNGAEFLQITKELADLEKRSNEQKVKGLDVYETENNLINKLAVLKEVVAEADMDAISSRRFALEIAQTQYALDQATLERRKADAQELTKAENERVAKIKEGMLAQEEQLTLQRLLLKEAEAAKNDAVVFTQADRERLALLKLMAEEKRNMVVIDDLILQKAVGGLKPAEEARLKALLEQTDNLQKQIGEATKLVDITKKRAEAEASVSGELTKQLNALLKQAGIRSGPTGLTSTGDKSSADLNLALYNARKVLGEAEFNYNTAGQNNINAATQARDYAQELVTALEKKVNQSGSGYQGNTNNQPSAMDARNEGYNAAMERKRTGADLGEFALGGNSSLASPSGKPAAKPATAPQATNVDKGILGGVNTLVQYLVPGSSRPTVGENLGDGIIFSGSADSDTDASG